MAQYSKGLEVPEKTNGGNSDLSWDDEIGTGGILEQGEAGGNKIREELPHSILPLRNYTPMFANPEYVFLYQYAAGGNKAIDSLIRCECGTPQETYPYISSFAQKLAMLLLECCFFLRMLNCDRARVFKGVIAHLDQWYVFQLAWWINVLLNWNTARGGEGGIAHLNLCEVVQLVIWINIILKRAAARGAEGNTAHFAGTSRPQNNMLLGSHYIDIKDEEPQSTDFMIPKPKNIYFLEWSAALDYSLYATGLKVAFLIPNQVGTAHLAGPQSYQRPDSIWALNNMSTSAANNPPGFSPGTSGPQNNMLLGSHNMDNKDEEPPQSTDFMIPKPNNMYFLEWSAALVFGLYTTGMRATALMPKYYSRTILLLLAISLICFFAVKVFYKKLPAKIANLATSLAIVCNGSCVLLMAGFFFAKIWQ